jgi:hypothetical protein
MGFSKRNEGHIYGKALHTELAQITQVFGYITRCKTSHFAAAGHALGRDSTWSSAGMLMIAETWGLYRLPWLDGLLATVLS